MAIDKRIAVTLVLTACGGAQRSRAPKVSATESATPKPLASPKPAPASGPSRFVGWFCPQSAAGRPGVLPLLAKTPEWTEDRARLARAIGTREVKRFEVFGVAGSIAGSFSVMGSGTSGGTVLAVGSYQGANACDVIDALGKVASTSATCEAETHGCALAVGPIEASSGFSSRPYDEDPERQPPAASGACEVGGNLVVDVDDDGAAERFDLSELFAGRSAVELPLVKEGSRVCEATFSALVDADAALYRVAVLDFDDDGRPEIAYRLGEEILIYGAPNSPARMELLGRASLTPAPK